MSGSPSPSIYIEKLVFSLPGIELVFNFREAVIIYGLEKTDCWLLHGSELDRLNEGGGPAKFRGMLPPTACRQELQRADTWLAGADRSVFWKYQKSTARGIKAAPKNNSPPN